MSPPDEPNAKPAASKGLTSYTCPGESYPISHSIHLARLAAFYSRCLDCEHRFDAAHLFPRPTDRPVEPERRTARTSLVNDENVRGVYLNELDRNRALAWGEAFAAHLWDQQPMVATSDRQGDAQIVDETSGEAPAVLSQGPSVVVGFDERPSSPDIVSGVVLGLRRMGCPVVDLGQTLLPIVAFNLRERRARAGLYVTGAGGDPSLTGFEFLAGDGIPFTRDELRQMERNSKVGVGRQTRQIGRHTPVQGQSAYEASLVAHFHALRPLKIVCGTSTRLMPRILDRLFSKLPCTLTHVPLPLRSRNLLDPRDPDLQRVARVVIEGGQHLGLIIDEDARRIAFVTDRGRLVTPKEVARILFEFAQREIPCPNFIVATSLAADASGWLQNREAKAIDAGEATENLVRLLVTQNAHFALASDGRVWFDPNHPKCDALLTLAMILQALSLSDAPFSDVVAKIGLDVRKAF